MVARGLLSSIVVAFVSFAAADEDIGLCCLCDGCAPPLTDRITLAVDDQGYTCNALVLDMADPSNHIKQGNGACRQLQGRWYDHCCNPNFEPLEIVQSPTVSPGAGYPSGDYEPCDLCRNKQFPDNPYTLAVVLDYPKVETCRDVYWAGLNGYFEERLCRPLQNYFRGPCGCGDEGIIITCPNGNPPEIDDDGSYICNSNNGGNSGGGAPDLPDPEEDENGNPPKKNPPKDDDKEGKIYGGDDQRGIDRKKKRVRGLR